MNGGHQNPLHLVFQPILSPPLPNLCGRQISIGRPRALFLSTVSGAQIGDVGAMSGGGAVVTTLYEYSCDKTQSAHRASRAQAHLLSPKLDCSLHPLISGQIGGRKKVSRQTRSRIPTIMVHTGGEGGQREVDELRQPSVHVLHLFWGRLTRGDAQCHACHGGHHPHQQMHLYRRATNPRPERGVQGHTCPRALHGLI